MNEPVKAKDVEMGRVYYSRKGTPCKATSREKKGDGTYEVIMDVNPDTDKSDSVTVTGEYLVFEKPLGARSTQPLEEEQPVSAAKPVKKVKAGKETPAPKKQVARASKQAAMRVKWQKLGVEEVVARYQASKKKFGAPPKLPKNAFLTGLLLSGPQTTEDMVRALRTAYKCSEKTGRNRLNKFHLYNRPYLENDENKKPTVYKFIKRKK